MLFADVVEMPPAMVLDPRLLPVVPAPPPPQPPVAPVQPEPVVPPHEPPLADRITTAESLVMYVEDPFCADEPPAPTYIL